MMKTGFVRAAALALLLGVAQPALALTPAEADAVVTIVEQLAVEMGEGMVFDAGGIFYDYDSLGASLIPAAGFNKQEWIVAYEAVAAAYMATIPEDEFNAIFEEPLAQLAASGLPEEQMQAMLAHVEGLIAETQQTRLSGMQYADVVRPLEDRLYELFYGDF